MSKASILVVDDQDSIRHFVAKALEEEGFQVRAAANVREARLAVEHEMPDLALLDLKLPDGTGLELLREIKKVQPEVTVILMTAFGELETAVEAMSSGAFWFVKKPFQNEELMALVERGLESQKLWIELRRLRHQAFSDEDFLHSQSPSMHEVYAIAEQVARGDTTSVLIEGESGTGKEYFANLIHRMSARHDKPFVEINCAAIPGELLESELFGHEKGAFTDAHRAKLGLFEEAHRGTLFLDEIGHLPMALQGKLLRALDERRVRRVGATQDRAVDVRIIAATHVDLRQAVVAGEFREDLFYRLNVVHLVLPPLREREGDVLALARTFAAASAARYGLPEPRLGADVRDALEAHTWPGNVRELRHAVERALLLSPPGTLDPRELVPARAATAAAADAPAAGRLADAIRVVAETALARHGGNRSAAARTLGISRARLQRILDREGGDDADLA